MARLWSRSGYLVVSVLLGACSNILGLSDYAIDPSLDQAGSSGKSGDSVGGQGGDAAGGAPAGGTSELPQAGSSTSGTSGMAGGSADGGMGGSAPGCVPSDCDDDIDCTVDSCADSAGLAAADQCVHAPDDSLCTADVDECVSCQQGIGCLATPITVTQLLANPAFDEATSDWKEVIQDTDLQQQIVHDDPDANTPGRSAWWEAAAPDAVDPAYVDLLQHIVLPAGTRSLRVSGVYKMLPGVVSPAADFTKAGLYEGTVELLSFHNWWGNELAQNVWTTFEYEAPPAKLQKLVERAASDPDLDLTFDIYGFTYDTLYFFDSLSLEAASCPVAAAQ